jgi:hypothetical protein
MSRILRLFSIFGLAGFAVAATAQIPCFVCSDPNNNTSVGFSALLQATGSNNTAAGYAALSTNTGGSNNTATGAGALFSNTSGTGNTATGYDALYANTTGNYNTALGFDAFEANASGSYTTAVGSYALAANTTGGYDTAFGSFALNDNTSGSGNTAFGYAALRSTSTGSNNIGFGYQSLYQDATGSNNIAMGYQAGYNLYNGSNNIEIGSAGGPGDNNVIRIGSTQVNAYIAGIKGSQVTGAAVYVSSSGQLGVLASSERYKTQITSLAGRTDKLGQLRPVSFHLKTDPHGAVQYGLIAEEVDKVYPELVIRGEGGRVEGVRYEELAPLLLNELQQVRRQMAELKRTNESLQHAVARLGNTKTEQAGSAQ